MLELRLSEGPGNTVALPCLNDLYRTAVHFVRDRTEAPDLVQEAYLQEWRGQEAKGGCL